MTKTLLSGRVTLFQGDALSVLTTLPDASVGAVLTDPPYSSGGLTLTERQGDPDKKYRNSSLKHKFPAMLGDAKDQHSWTLWCTLWLAECWRIAQAGAPLMVFTGWRQLPALADAVQAAGWIWRGIIVWDKRVGRPCRDASDRSVSMWSLPPKGPWPRLPESACRDCTHIQLITPASCTWPVSP